MIFSTLRAGQPSARLFPFAIFLIAFLVPKFSAQPDLFAGSKPKDKPYALIAGTVWGPDDHPVYGVTVRSEEHTSELQSRLLISYSVFCLDRKSTRLNSSHVSLSRMPSSA